MFRKITTILFLTMPFSANAERLYGHFEPSKFKAQRIGLKYEMDYFNTSGNFALGSNEKVSLQNDNSFETLNFHLQADYDVSSKLSYTFGLRFGSSSSRSSGVNRSNTAVKGIFLGGAYKLRLIKGWASVADIRYYLAQERNSLSSDIVSIGDGVNWFAGGLWLGKRLGKQSALWNYFGLKLRGGGLSDLFLYSVRPFYKSGKFKFGGGLEGFISVTDDDNTDNPTPRLLVSSQLNGNSFRYFSVNPSYHELQGFISYKFKSFTELKVGLGMPILGESTADGLRAFLTFEKSLGWNGRSLDFDFTSMKKRKRRNKTRVSTPFSGKKRKAKKKSPFSVPIK